MSEGKENGTLWIDWMPHAENVSVLRGLETMFCQDFPRCLWNPCTLTFWQELENSMSHHIEITATEENVHSIWNIGKVWLTGNIWGRFISGMARFDCSDIGQNLRIESPKHVSPYANLNFARRAVNKDTIATHARGEQKGIGSKLETEKCWLPHWISPLTW